MRRTSLSILLLSLLGLCSVVPAFAQQIPEGRRANARKLLRIADGASNRLIQKAQGRFDRDARSRPFWEALLQMDAQIDRVGAGLRIRDAAFFQALRSGTSSLAEVQVTWALAGVKDPVIEQDLRTLSAAFGRLRNRYGPEWVRFQTGRPLSEDERQRFARMRAEQSFLAGKLEPLRDRAEQAGDHATAGELTLLLAQIHGVATASVTLGDYLDASVATDSIRGAWFGARAAHATDEEGWAEADQVVSDITTDESVGFVFTSDLKTVQDWSFVEEETEIPEEIAEADQEEGEEPAPGRIADLGSAKETEEQATDVPEGAESFILTEPVEDETWSEEPAEGALEDLPAGGALDELTEEPDTGSEAAADLDVKPVPGDETIEEEDLDAKAAPGEATAPAPEGCTAADGAACGDSAVPPAGTPPPAATPAAPPPPAAPSSPPMG